MKRFDLIIRTDVDSNINKYVKIVKSAIGLFFLLKKDKTFSITECEIDQNEKTKEVLIEISW